MDDRGVLFGYGIRLLPVAFIVGTALVVGVGSGWLDDAGRRLSEKAFSGPGGGPERGSTGRGTPQ